MRIECPSCAAIYQVPDGLLATGQSVSCARCGQAWMPIAPVAAAAPVVPAEPPPAAPPPAAPQVAMPMVPARPLTTVRDEPAPPPAAALPAAPLGVEPPALSPEDWPELSLPPEIRPAEPPRVKPVNAVNSSAPGWPAPARTAPDLVEPGPAAPARAAARMPVMEPDNGRQDWFDRDEPGWTTTPERSMVVSLAWIANLVLLAALCGTAVMERDWLMQSWPPSSRLFAALGLDDR